MAMPGTLICLQHELKTALHTAESGEKLTCLGKSKAGSQCHNPLNKKKLKPLLEEIVELLENPDSSLLKLLEEASLLVLCGRHQNQASKKLEEWKGGIPAEKPEAQESENEVGGPRKLFLGLGRIFVDGHIPQMLRVIPTAKLSTGPVRKQSPTKDSNTLGTNVEDVHALDSRSSSECVGSSLTPPFEDSDFQSGDDEGFIDSENDLSRNASTSTSSRSVRYVVAPQTPRKAIKSASTDSGISMTFDSSEGVQTKEATQCRDGSVSPLTERLSRANARAARRRSRPDPTPIQHKPSDVQPEPLPKPLALRGKPLLPGPGSPTVQPEEIFVSMTNPFEKIRKYICKPFKDSHGTAEGAIYGFQIEGCAFTKVGEAGKRDSEPDLDASLQARMREHEESGRHGLSVVMEFPVIHGQRIEKLIHYHMDAGRMKEKCSCVGRDGQRLRHAHEHKEWFNNSLDEIWTITIAWRHWSLTMPYVKGYKDMYYLRPEWKSRLESLDRVQREGRDNWLEWLCKHVPDMPEAIKKATMDRARTMEEEEEARSAVHASFMRNSADGVKCEIKRTRTSFV